MVREIDRDLNAELSSVIHKNSPPPQNFSPSRPRSQVLGPTSSSSLPELKERVERLRQRQEERVLRRIQRQMSLEEEQKAQGSTLGVKAVKQKSGSNPLLHLGMCQNCQTLNHLLIVQ